eukprot:2665494-Pyramimonas_sp.AAC.1
MSTPLETPAKSPPLLGARASKPEGNGLCPHLGGVIGQWGPGYAAWDGDRLSDAQDRGFAGVAGPCGP